MFLLNSVLITQNKVDYLSVY